MPEARAPLARLIAADIEELTGWFAPCFIFVSKVYLADPPEWE